MIHPVALAVGGLNVVVGMPEGGGQELLWRDSQGEVMVADVPEQLTRGERSLKHSPDLFGINDVSTYLLESLLRQRESHPLDRQGVVPIRLDQTHKSAHVEVSNLWVEEHICAPILIDVPVVQLALGIRRGAQVKHVVIPLRIAMFAGVDMENDGCILITQQHRPAAAQQVVQIGLPAVCVEDGQTGLCGDGIRQFQGQPVRLAELFLQEGGVPEPCRLLIEVLLVSDMAEDRVDCRGSRKGEAWWSARRSCRGSSRW